jgi:hypothetical protein
MFASGATGNVLKGLKTDHELTLILCDVTIHITNRVGFSGCDVANFASKFQVFNGNFLPAFVKKFVSQVTDQYKALCRTREQPKQFLECKPQP